MRDFLSHVLGRSHGPNRSPQGTPASTGDGLGARAAEVPSTVAIRLRALLETTDQLLFVIDERGDIAGASLPLLELLGRPPESLTNASVSEVFNVTPDLIADGQSGPVTFRDASGKASPGTLSISAIPGSSASLLRIGFLTPSNPTPPPPSPAARGVLTKQKAQLSAALKVRFKDQPPPHQVTAGRFELISLDDVKHALGNRWPMYSERARAVARTVLTKRLSVEDVFSEVAEGTFLVCYASMPLAEARANSDQIAIEIRNRLIGENNAAFSVVSEVETVTIDNADSGTTGGDELFSSLLSQLDQARAAKQQEAARRFSAFVASATLCLTPVIDKKFARTGLVVASLGGESDEWIASLTSGNQPEKAAFELDALLLSRALTHLYVETGKSRALGIIIPLHYSTLNERRFADQFSALCARIDAPQRARILFEVRKVPQDVPDLRLQDIFCRLEPYSAFRILEVADLGRRFVDLNRFRLAMISVAASVVDVAREQRSHPFDAFAKMVRQGGSNSTLRFNGGCRLLVYNCADVATAKWYGSHGADFLAHCDQRNSA